MLKNVDAGANAPNEVNVIIEIPAHSNPVKYEVDKKTGALFVDRLLTCAMQYPCNYGYVPNTLSEDGDPIDVLVPTPFPLINGSVISVRPVGVLKMADEAGVDSKILAVPANKITPLYRNIKEYSDLPEMLLKQIAHFFDHYKDLEEGKWVKIDGWEGADAAIKEIEDSIGRFTSS